MVDFIKPEYGSLKFVEIQLIFKKFLRKKYENIANWMVGFNEIESMCKYNVHYVHLFVHTFIRFIQYTFSGNKQALSV